MRDIKFLILVCAVFFSLDWPSLHAATNQALVSVANPVAAAADLAKAPELAQLPDLVLAIEMNLELIAQLDQFNLHVAKSYVDCACHQLAQQGIREARCEGRGRAAGFTQNKINHLGQEVSESQVCSIVIDKLSTRVEKLSHSTRVNLALIRSYQRAQTNHSASLQSERSTSKEQFLVHVSSGRQNHLQPIADGAETLEQFSDVEMKAAFKRHQTFADETRTEFLKSPSYLALFAGLDSAAVLNFLKTGQPGALPREIMSLIKQEGRVYSQWMSLRGLIYLYRSFLRDARASRLVSLEEDYRKQMNSLPLLYFLESSSASPQVLLTALLKVTLNAEERAQDSIRAVQSFKTLKPNLSENVVVTDYASVMDHSLSQLYMPAVLHHRLGWPSSKSVAVLSRIADRRSRQIQVSKYVQTGVLVGGTLLCLAPYPGIQLLTIGVKLLARNFCLLGASGGLNTYFLLDSHSNYEGKVRTFLSTPDGWNQMTKLNQVLLEKDRRDSWLLFYAFEALPAFEIGKFLLRL